MPLDKNYDSIKDFVGNLQEYFDAEAKKIKKGRKKDVKNYTPEMRAMFLEMPDHLKACATEIERIEKEAADEFEKEKHNLPPEIKNSPEEILKILADKKRAKFNESEVARTIFTIACASDMPMSECLAFADEFGIKDLSSFDLNTGLSPLAAAMLRRVKPVVAMKSLVRAGADIHALSLEGNNIAHMAALFGVNKATLNYLISNKVNFNQVNKNGFTALDMAVGRRDLDFIKYLQDKADAKFKFTPKKLQDALDDEDKLQELSKAQAAKSKKKSAIDEKSADKATKGEVEKAFAELKALEKNILDVAKPLTQLSEGIGRNLVVDNSSASASNKSWQQQVVNSNVNSQAPNIDVVKVATDLARSIKDQEQKLKEQEQLLRALQRGEKSGSSAGSIDDFIEKIRALSHAISVATRVIKHAAQGEFDEIRGLIVKEFNIAAKERPIDNSPNEVLVILSQAVQEKLQRPEDNSWRKHLKPPSMTDKDKSFVDMVKNSQEKNTVPKQSAVERFVKKDLSRGVQPASAAVLSH